MGKSSNKLPSREKEERYREIVGMFRKHKTQEDVVAYLGEKYNLSVQAARREIRRTCEWIGRDDARTIEYYRQNAKNLQITRLEEVYAACMDKSNFRAAIEALKELDKIMGLYETNNITNVQIDPSKTGDAVIHFRFGGAELDITPPEQQNVQQIGEVKYVEPDEL